MSWKTFKRVFWIGFIICLSIAIVVHLTVDSLIAMGASTGLFIGWVCGAGGAGLGWYYPEERTDDCA